MPPLKASTTEPRPTRLRKPSIFYLCLASKNQIAHPSKPPHLQKRKQWNFAPSTSTPNPAPTERAPSGTTSAPPPPSIPEKPYLVKTFPPLAMRKKPSGWKPSGSVRLIPPFRDGMLLFIPHSISNRVGNSFEFG